MHLFRFLVSKVFVVNVLIAIFLIAGGLYFVMHYLDEYTLHGYSQEVPDCQGKTFEAVDSDLQESNFKAIIADSIYVKEVQAGLILSQDPRAGKKVKRGRKVYLTVAAKRPPQVSMPSLVDMSLRQAMSLMETYGLVLGELTYQPDPCMNCVLSQSYKGEAVEAGQKVDKGAKIDLALGQGLSDELTVIPYLIGINFEMARNVLQAGFLNAGIPNYDETVQTEEDSLNARIYKQVPFHSDEPKLQMGSSVDLYLTLDTNKIIHTVNPTDSL